MEKIPIERKRLTRFVMIGPTSLKQSFQKQNWDGIKGTLLTFRSRSVFVNFSDRNIKLISFEGGADGKRNGSGESDGKNVVRMSSSLSSKKSVLAMEDASGDSGVSLKNFDEDSFWGFSGCARIDIWFREVKGKLPASPTSLKSITLFLGSANYRINSWTISSDLIGAWM